jgi:hypothetical protein
MKDLYEKMELLNGADENGRYWEIRPRTFTEVLRETDMVELADWIARELGWIRRDRDVDGGHLGELEREGHAGDFHDLDSVGCGGDPLGWLKKKELELEGDPGELERGGDPEKLERGGDPGELERGGDPGELERGADASGGARRKRRRRRRRSREVSSPREELKRGVSPKTFITALKLLQAEKALNEILSIILKK